MTLINPTRRSFLKGGAALFGSGWLLNSTALAAVDPNSFSGRVFSASHYGPFEAVVRDGRIVGIITSGNYGHHLGGAIGMGYVPARGESEADILGSTYEIEIAGERFAAEASLKPMYDPRAERVRV